MTDPSKNVFDTQDLWPYWIKKKKEKKQGQFFFFSFLNPNPRQWIFSPTYGGTDVPNEPEKSQNQNLCPWIAKQAKKKEIKIHIEFFEIMPLTFKTCRTVLNGTGVPNMAQRWNIGSPCLTSSTIPRLIHPLQPYNKYRSQTYRQSDDAAARGMGDQHEHQL
jgi:hypothetical protein